MIESASTLGRIRTCDLRFRKPLLYPLSYEGDSINIVVFLHSCDSRKQLHTCNAGQGVTVVLKTLVLEGSFMVANSTKKKPKKPYLTFSLFATLVASGLRRSRVSSTTLAYGAIRTQH